MNQRVEFLRQRNCLAARAATSIDDNVKLAFRKKVQDMQSMSIASRTELPHTPEKKLNGIVGAHRSLHCL
jgi:hypothetical protein